MAHRPEHRLRKELSLVGVFAIATGATLSAGLFLLPGLAAAQAGPAIVLCYVLAVVPLVPAAYSMVELSTAMPRAGGAYYFLDRSLGPLAGTVGGLGTWLALTLKTSFALIGMGAYLSLFVTDASGPLIKLVAVGFALTFGIINWLGAKTSALFQTLLVGGLLAILTWFVARGAGDVAWHRFGGFFDAGGESIIATAGLVYISYVGVTKVASLSEEVKNPERTLPWAVFFSMVVVVIVYAVCTWVMVGVVPMETLSTSLTPMAEAAEAFAGQTGVIIVSVAALLAFASVSNAGIMSASRYPLAMGRDHLVPKRFAAFGARGTPTLALAVTVALVIVFLLFLDPLKIAKLASAFQLLMFALICLAVIIMRESQIRSYDPGFRSPLYPWMQIVGMVLPALMIISMGWLPIVFTGMLVGLGIAWYMWYARSRVTRHGAIYHVFERVGRLRFDELDVELRTILKEKGLRRDDPFEEIIARAKVIDARVEDTFEHVAREAADVLSRRLGCPIDTLVNGFLDGTRKGLTPTSHGVALPHLRLPDIARPEVVLVRARDGIHIDVGDVISATTITTDMHAVFFLVSPDDDPGQHLRVLANLATHVEADDFEERWLNAHGPHEVRSLLMKEDDPLVITLDANGPTAPLIDRRLREIDLPDRCLVAIVQRGKERFVPDGLTTLREGDRLSIIGEPVALAALEVEYRGRESGLTSDQAP